MKKYFYIIGFILFSCNRPEHRQDSTDHQIDKRFYAYLAEWYYLQELYKNQPALLKDSLLQAANQVLLQQFNLTSEQIKTMSDAAYQTPESYQKLLDSVKSYVNLKYLN